jgi:hypothetical protein
MSVATKNNNIGRALKRKGDVGRLLGNKLVKGLLIQ